MTTDPEEIKKFETLDPLNCFLSSNEKAGSIVAEIKNQIEFLAEETKIEIKDKVELNRHKFIYHQPYNFAKKELLEASSRIKDNINSALGELLRDNPELHILGEDIQDYSSNTTSVYGGALSVTSGLRNWYPERVLTLLLVKAVS